MVKRSRILFAVLLNILDSDFSMRGIKSKLKMAKFWLIVSLIISPKTLSPPNRSSRSILPFLMLILKRQLNQFSSD